MDKLLAQYYVLDTSAPGLMVFHTHLGLSFVDVIGTVENPPGRSRSPHRQAPALADNLDQHGSPIDYDRRRAMITPDLLTDQQWRRICRDTDTRPGLGRRFLDARRYLLTQLTGSDLNNPRPH